MNPTQLPTDGTLPLLVLHIIAVSGEFPAAFSGHFPGGCSYIESVIGKLKKDGLLRSYTKNGLRGLRLTASAKRLLLQKYPFDLAPYLITRSSRQPPKRGVCRSPAAPHRSRSGSRTRFPAASWSSPSCPLGILPRPDILLCCAASKMKRSSLPIQPTGRGANRAGICPSF